MTINNSYTPVLVDGDDTTATINFSFKVFSEEEVVVKRRNKTTLVEDTLTLTDDYTVALSTTGEGGVVTLVEVTDSDYEYFVGSDITATQTASFPLGQALREDNIELMGDKLCRLVQQVLADAQSAVRFAFQQEAPELPALVSGEFLTNDGSALSWATPTNIDYPATISRGLDAGKSASPSAGYVYYATDTSAIYVCFTAGSWTTIGYLTSAAQTIAGVKTFSSFPITPSSAPTTDYQVANRKYVIDTVAASGGKYLATTVSVDLSTASSTQAISLTGLGGTPKAVFVAATVENSAGWSIGFSSGATASKGIYGNKGGTADSHGNAAQLITFITSSGNDNTAVVSSFANEQLNITWTKTGSPTGTCFLNILAIA